MYQKNLTSNNILLCWAITKGLYVLPRSSNPSHIRDKIQYINNITLDHNIMDYVDTFYHYEDKNIGYSIYPNYLL